MTSNKQPGQAQREPAEVVYRKELQKLVAMDEGPVPPGWQLSPRSVARFLLGDARAGIERKFVADPEVVNRIIISLCTSRGSLLVGEPGTAKSWLSELLAAAISGSSTLVVQGGSVSDVRQLLYGWNEAILRAEGPVREALVPSPLLRGMMEGRLVRFEELARCPQTLQDALLSVLSDRVVSIPELPGEEGIILARQGFNLIATSNSVDAGVHQMSAALKRRMDFEQIRPISRLEDELEVVGRELEKLNRDSGVKTEMPPEVLEILVTVFHELRNGQTMDGRSTDRLAGSALSTAEAVSVAHAASLGAWYLGDGKVTVILLLRHLVGAVLKDKPEDRRRLRHYFDTAVAPRKGAHWQAVRELQGLIGT
ncbi:MAG: AAA family ATPase [Pseudomonadota bacterium]|nr:AAA family ATPase [Pseudomonadota bacterium]